MASCDLPVRGFRLGRVKDLELKICALIEFGIGQHKHFSNQPTLHDENVKRLVSLLVSSFLLVTPHSNKQKVLQVKEEPENNTPKTAGSTPRISFKA